MLPNLLIVGAQKSGTTWLHHALDKHPEIFASSKKELNFFNKANFGNYKSDYIKNFSNANSELYRLESTPHYFRQSEGSINIAERISQTLGRNVKLILMVRDPIQRYESSYIHHMMQGRIPYTEIIDEMTDDYRMLSLGKYGAILSEWHDWVDNIGVFTYENLLFDRASLHSKVLSFLGLDDVGSKGELDFHVNSKVQKRSQEGSLAATWPAMPRISSSLRAKLYDFYEADMLYFERCVGIRYGREQVY